MVIKQETVESLSFSHHTQNKFPSQQFSKRAVTRSGNNTTVESGNAGNNSIQDNSMAPEMGYDASSAYAHLMMGPPKNVRNNLLNVVPGNIPPNLMSLIYKDMDPNRYVCEICKKTFKYPSGLKTHMVIHENKSFPCTLCDKVFRMSNSLQMHMMNKHGLRRRFLCHVCSRRFSAEVDLVEHMTQVHGAVME